MKMRHTADAVTGSAVAPMYYVAASAAVSALIISSLRETARCELQ